MRSFLKRWAQFLLLAAALCYLYSLTLVAGEEVGNGVLMGYEVLLHGVIGSLFIIFYPSVWGWLSNVVLLMWIPGLLYSMQDEDGYELAILPGSLAAFGLAWWTAGKTAQVNAPSFRISWSYKFGWEFPAYRWWLASMEVLLLANVLLVARRRLRGNGVV